MRICRLMLACAKKGLLPSGLAFGLLGIMASGLSAEKPMPTCYVPMPKYYGPKITKIIAFPNPARGVSTVRVVATLIGYEPGQIVAKAEAYGSFSDYQRIPMKPADGAFDSDSEDAYLDLNVSSWAEGTYTIYAQGYNDLGDWGGPSAVNIEVTPEQ